MTKRQGDTTPEPPGGRAAERLKMFEQARQPEVASIPTALRAPESDEDESSGKTKSRKKARSRK
jgi:hypothetical protein